MLLCCTITPLVIAEESQAATGYKIYTDPNFVFVGDSMELKVIGPPGEYGYLIINTENGSKYQDLFILLDENGVYIMEFTPPLEILPGNYTAALLVDGNETARAGFEVIFNEYLYLRLRFDELQSEYDKQVLMAIENAKLTTKLRDELNSYQWVLIISCAGGIIAALITIKYFKPWQEWKMGLKRRNTRSKQIAYEILHPYARDRMDKFIDYVGPNLKHEKESRRMARKGMQNIEPVLVLPSDETPSGMEIISIKDEGVEQE